MRSRRWVLLLVLGLLVAGPVAAQVTNPPTNPLGPMPAPPENPLTDEKALLGKFLFWEEQVSSDNAVACGTCHLPFAGGSDPRSTSVFSAHPGADGMFGTVDDVAGSVGVVRQDCDGNEIPGGPFHPERQVTGRRTPTFIGAGYSDETFWDGRAGSEFVDPADGTTVLIASGGALENQAVGPIFSDIEMACVDREWADVQAKLETVVPMALATALPGDMESALMTMPDYPALFANAFGDPAITEARFAFAVASYERTLVPDQTPLDEFLDGDLGALTGNQQAGLDLFIEHCTVCHAGDELSDHSFRNIGVRPWEEDDGRMTVTGDFADRGKFKTPPLRNVALKAPFFHNGGKATLDDVLIFYNVGGDFTEDNNLDSDMVALDLTNGELAQIKDFIEIGLTDPRVVDELFPFSRPQLQVYFRRGDSNVDDEFTLADPLHALEYMFLGGPNLLCEDATDADDNGIIGLYDAILMLERLFNGAPPLPEPSDLRVGPDATPGDPLDCRP